ncbi:CLUMA_CG011651, isoform A [Clunio marinus]|uniref:CLUMA_CG011651, isoform A n=1 Tax=Clunio marinus TaxID=568069 RepID=A0A1J1IIK5_9DIPT|nr:CLUMA_CG011651, isoform A [Clunio marinus]
MIYYADREIIDQNQSCLNLGCAGKFIAFIELVFYSFIFFSVQSCMSGEIGKLYILATVLGLLSIFSVSLCIGVINQNRMFISLWIWLKYSVIVLQVIRFISLIIELAASDKNPAGASPIFELLFLGYNVFALSIILELVEEIEPYTFKRFQYVRV